MRKLPELKDKKLGTAISNFKKSFMNEESYEKYILNNSTESIMNYFIKKIETII